MIIKGKIAWFAAEAVVTDKDGNAIRNYFGEIVKKRRIGINADYQLEDGSIVRERFVTETPRSWSDAQLEEWQEAQAVKEFTLHFDDKEASSGHHFQNIILTDIK